MLIAVSAQILLSNPFCAERAHGFSEKWLRLGLVWEIGKMSRVSESLRKEGGIGDRSHPNVGVSSSAGAAARHSR